MDIIGNALSALGAILLFTGYYQISIKKNEKSGITLSGAGSFVMIFAFYIFESYAFITLNVIWLCISIYGLFKRSDKASSYTPSKTILYSAHGILTLFLVIGLLLLITQSYEALSWVTISVMVISYTLFSSKIFTSTHYVAYSMGANLISMPYLYFIGNLSSLIQTGISIFISMVSLKNNNSPKMETDKEKNCEA